MRLLLCILLAASFSVSATQRNPKQKYAFRKSHPCPSTHKTTGACPGYVVDHIYPLCAGGADSPENLQWQSYDDSLTKDKWERSICRSMKK